MCHYGCDSNYQYNQDFCRDSRYLGPVIDKPAIESDRQTYDYYVETVNGLTPVYVRTAVNSNEDDSMHVLTENFRGGGRGGGEGGVAESSDPTPKCFWGDVVRCARQDIASGRISLVS